MTVTATSLRTVFPEFGDTAKYPDTLLNTWLGVAVGFVNAAKWGDQTDFGVMLWTCHRVTMAARAATAATAGKVPGQFSGILTSKGADGISAGYDASSVTLEGRGHWNMTTYGLQFSELSNLMGAGPVQVGVDDSAGVGSWFGVVNPPF
jgi:hypothetical protein